MLHVSKNLDFKSIGILIRIFFLVKFFYWIEGKIENKARKLFLLILRVQGGRS